ncbi:hypothetical protein GH733_002625 [Mirounga leonina]|nr:hypothetical protein GH733_002625 [Mirounga leonina]
MIILVSGASTAQGVNAVRGFQDQQTYLLNGNAAFSNPLPYNIVRFCQVIDIIYSLITDCDMSKRMDVAVQITESIALFHSCLNPILNQGIVHLAETAYSWQKQVPEAFCFGHFLSRYVIASFNKDSFL